MTVTTKKSITMQEPCQKNSCDINECDERKCCSPVSHKVPPVRGKPSSLLYLHHSPTHIHTPSHTYCILSLPRAVSIMHSLCWCGVTVSNWSICFRLLLPHRRGSCPCSDLPNRPAALNLSCYTKFHSLHNFMPLSLTQLTSLSGSNAYFY